MFKTVLAFVILLIGSPPISLDWRNSNGEEFQFTFKDPKDSCRESFLKNGKKIEYRFLIEGCVDTGLFGPNCGKTIVQIHHVREDPIAEGFKVQKDRLADDLEPRAVTFSTAEEALAFASVVESITGETLRARTPGIDFKSNKKTFVRARVVADCKSSFGETVSWLPHILTFGIIGREDYDSGWFNFDYK